MSDSWLEHLTALLAAVAAGRSGQVGRVEVFPPDARSAARLTAGPAAVVVTDGSGGRREFAAADSAKALSAFVAAVEGDS
jgi:hypothetical protein